MGQRAVGLAAPRVRGSSGVRVFGAELSRWDRFGVAASVHACNASVRVSGGQAQGLVVRIVGCRPGRTHACLCFCVGRHEHATVRLQGR